jgi:hypothetical protein
MKSQLENDFRTALTRFRPIEFHMTPKGNVEVTIANVPVNRSGKHVVVSTAVIRAIQRAKLPYYLFLTRHDVKANTHSLTFTRKVGT